MAYSVLKLIHIISVVIFLSNITTGLFWALRAHNSKDFNKISSTFQNITKSDNLFTVPSIIVITASGVFAAINGSFPLLRTGWIFWPIILFTLSGIIFTIYVAPLQVKIRKFTSEKEYNETNWQEYETLFKRWESWGLLALITPYAALAIMILKPGIPGM